MDQKLQDKLIKKYPFLKRKRFGQQHDIPQLAYDLYGIETGNGWYKLIDELLTKTGPVKVHQIKEKNGSLRFYCESDKQDEIRKAEEESFKICEQCGKEGKLRNDNGWFRTECEVCRKKRLK